MFNWRFFKSEWLRVGKPDLSQHVFAFACNGKSFILSCSFFALACNALQLPLQLPFFFCFFSSFSLQRFWTGWQKNFACVPSVVVVSTGDQYRTYFVDILANNDVYVLKFRVWDHDIPYAVEINSNGEFKRRPCRILLVNHLKHISTATMPMALITWP